MRKNVISAIDVTCQRTGASLRAVGYFRVSTEEQAKGYGIAYTQKRVTKYVGKKGWDYVRSYADEGYSGSLDHTQRPDLKSLMEDAQRVPRPFDVVVVSEERAIGRRDRAFWPWVWKLEDLGILVAIVKGDYDNTTEEGRSRMRKAQDAAEDERVVIRDRTQGGVQEKAESGGWPGGPAPYGWRIDNQGRRGESRAVLFTGDERSPHSLLHRARNLLVHERMTCGQIEILYESEGIPGPNGDNWPKGCLRHILHGQAVQESRRLFRDPGNPRCESTPMATPCSARPLRSRSTPCSPLKSFRSSTRRSRAPAKAPGSGRATRSTRCPYTSSASAGPTTPGPPKAVPADAATDVRETGSGTAACRSAVARASTPN
ncbi:hypothetical protein C7M71_005410 [Peterkaempfera bronchialis]|uniref:Resolvase/invertase-type recombinase catalytic domain-containing protein n=1 Tax=Peterkaempfera bronchialis TaxID=2126346 RepID=A0A345STB8_9ACTN|nr:hypothetical protein C7M71_005410 [Peterkaempfera bronchialis]